VAAAALAQILTRLTQGADPATIATQFLPGGSFANGGAMRIAPVGLAYRNADAATLQEAVEAALLCTHVHPLGVEGAVAQASSRQCA
jgi:poly(ADP-ribose) glycohydrolase ARH3